MEEVPAPREPSPAPMVDLLYEKAVAFTEVEVVTLEAWDDAIGFDTHLAHRILQAGLLAEHYKSLLSEDPALVTPEQSGRLSALLNALRDLLRELGGRTSKEYHV